MKSFMLVMVILMVTAASPSAADELIFSDGFEDGVIHAGWPDLPWVDGQLGWSLDYMHACFLDVEQECFEVWDPREDCFCWQYQMNIPAGPYGYCRYTVPICVPEGRGQR